MLRQLKKYREHLLVLVLIVSSGNPLFILSPHVRELYIGTVFLLMWLKRRKVMSPYIKYSAPFIYISLFQMLLFPDYSVSSGVFLLLKIFIGVLIMMEVSRKFAKIYLDIMVVVAGISIPLFFYNEYVGFIPGIPFTDIGTSLVVYTQLFSDYGGFIHRNAGMFWEPGAYQGYLNFAILFCLLMNNGATRIFMNWKFVVLLIALFTTKSTTGYVVLAFIILYYYHYYYRGNLMAKLLFLLFFTCVFMYAYYSLEFLGDKMHMHMNRGQDEEGRFNDFVRFGSYIYNYFFLGNPTIVGTTIVTGNGFLSFLFYYGIWGILYYFIALWHNIHQQVDLHTTAFFVGVTFISLQGEGFIYFPCYLAWPFIQLSMKNKILLKE